MESDSVVFGKWDNHSNDMNLRLSAQSSQKVGEDTHLVFKHGNKQIRSIEKASDLRYIIKYTLIVRWTNLTWIELLRGLNCSTSTTAMR
jgi:hypothetical protein